MLHPEDYLPNLSSEEWQVLRDLAKRWKVELESTVYAIDEMPREMRPAAYDELDKALDQANSICEALNVE